MADIVLSLFPGLGLLDRAFEEEGYCVVRGPDLLWGGAVQRFRPEMERFEGIIGSPPCQVHSDLAAFGTTNAVDLTPEFLRVVDEAWPDWWVMENVPDAPVIEHPYYAIADQLLDNHWFGGEQERRRRFTFGIWRGDREISPIDLRRFLEFSPLEAPARFRTVTAAHAGHGTGVVKMARYTVEDALRLQGLPEDLFAHSPFTRRAQLKMVANGVPLPMGRAIAKAVRRAVKAAGITR